MAFTLERLIYKFFNGSNTLIVELIEGSFLAILVELKLASFYKWARAMS